MSDILLYAILGGDLQTLVGGAGSLMHRKDTLMKFCNAYIKVSAQKGMAESAG